MHLGGLFDGFLDGADHIEGLFGEVVVLACQDFGEAADGVAEGDVFAGLVGEGFGDEEGLGEEALDAAGAEDGLAVVVGEFLDAEDGDDVLQVAVALEYLLDAAGYAVVFLADDAGFQDAGEGGEGVNGGVEALGGEGAFQGDYGVQVSEGGYDAGVGVVVGGDIDGLEGGDAAAFGGGDAFLEGTHFGAQGGLVAYGGGHSAQEGGYFHTGEDVAVDVVDEEEDVLVLFLAEVFGHSEAGESDAGADAGGFVHLSEDEDGAAEDAGVLHFVPEVVAFAGAFADAGEDGHAAVDGADVADEFLDDDGFAHAGAAVGANFAALGEGGDEVENLDAGFQDFHVGVLVVEGGRVAVDGPELAGFYGAEVVQGGAGDVEEASEGFGADGDGDFVAGVVDVGAAGEAVGGAEGEAAGPVVADVLLDFQHQAVAGVVHFQGVKEVGELVGGELDIHHRADDLGDFAGHLGLSSGGRWGGCWGWGAAGGFGFRFGPGNRGG